MLMMIPRTRARRRVDDSSKAAPERRHARCRGHRHIRQPIVRRVERRNDALREPPLDATATNRQAARPPLITFSRYVSCRDHAIKLTIFIALRSGFVDLLH